MHICEKEIAGIKNFCLTLTEKQFLKFLEILREYSKDVIPMENLQKGEVSHNPDI